MNAPPLPCLCSRRIGFYGSLQGGKWVPEEEVIAEAFDVPIPGYATKTCGNLRLWNALPVEEFNLDAFNEGNYEKVGGWLLCGWVCVCPPPPQRSAAQRSAAQDAWQALQPNSPLPEEQSSSCWLAVSLFGVPTRRWMPRLLLLLPACRRRPWS